jgi:hypothetical protein
VERDHEARLAVVKSVHTAIYAVQIAATLYILAAGATGRRGRYLVTIESLVFFGNGRRCPLTVLARNYGDPKGYVGDTWFSERCTRHNFAAFASLLTLGTGLIAVRRLRGSLR